jgi:site-specific recombinase XerD
MAPTLPTNESTTLSAVTPEFLAFAEVELGFAQQSIIKYRDCLRQITRILGDKRICQIDQDDVLALKSNLLRRGLSASRQVSILSALKRLLFYCRDVRAIPVLDPRKIVLPKRPRKEVVYLDKDEIDCFVNGIKLNGGRGKVVLTGVRFRALVEVILGTAMRIGEVLALDRDQIDFKEREAKIVGKGGKQRTVFFTERSLEWLQRYLDIRSDQAKALFACQNGRDRLKRADIWRSFEHYRRRAGIKKPVRPHILRHTAATWLLFNGCPVSHIKEILGHERLETTCRYYLGLDHRAAKLAHRDFMIYR